MTKSLVINWCPSCNDFPRLTTILVLVLQWIIDYSCGQTNEQQTYSMSSLCASHPSTRISLEPASRVRLELTLDDFGTGGRTSIDGCEIVVETSNRHDGLLLSYERFQFAGSDTAAVFHGVDCGTMRLDAWHGETHRLSTCLGEGLDSAPAMSTVSSIGIVRLRITSLASNELSPTRPIKFGIIATASRTALTATTECPSGCCAEPYVFRCPLLEQCIDKKSASSGLQICGQEPSNDGPACNDSSTKTNEAMNGLADDKRVNFDDLDGHVSPAMDESVDEGDGVARSIPLRFQASDTSAGAAAETVAVVSKRRAEERQIFYSRVEMVCGVLSMALFCLAGIAVFTCRSTRRRAGSLTSAPFIDDDDDRSRPSATGEVAQSETTNDNQSDSDASLQQTMTIENETYRYGSPLQMATPTTSPRPKPCRNCSAVFYAGDATTSRLGCGCRRPGPEDPAPPSYDSLYPPHRSQ